MKERDQILEQIRAQPPPLDTEKLGDYEPEDSTITDLISRKKKQTALLQMTPLSDLLKMNNGVEFN